MMVHVIVDMNVVFEWSIIYGGASIDSLEFGCRMRYVIGCRMDNGACSGR